MVRHRGSSAGSYLANRTSPIPSHCASIVVTSTLRVKTSLYIKTTECRTLYKRQFKVDSHHLQSTHPHKYITLKIYHKISLFFHSHFYLFQTGCVDVCGLFALFYNLCQCCFMTKYTTPDNIL